MAAEMSASGQGVPGEAGVDDTTYIRNVNTTKQGPDQDVAFVTVRLSDSRLGHQPMVMRSASPPLHKTVGELESRVARQETTIAQLKAAAAKQEAVNAEQRKGMEIVTAHLKEQDAKIQKVSDKVELSKPAPRTVENNQ